MISDVLFHAVVEIERYEQDMPEVYGEMTEKIAAVKKVMKDLQLELDTLPAGDAGGRIIGE